MLRPLGRYAALVLCLTLLPVGVALAEKRPDSAEVLIAKGRLFAVVLGPGPAWKRGQPFKGPGLDEHRRYWKKLHGEGRVASAGPLGQDTGLAVVRAKDQREIDGLIANDPAVRARILRGVARPYSAELVSTAVLIGR
jgi:uncharacterized protein